MRNTFCNKQFRSLMFTGAVTVVIQFLLVISDTIVVGNILGEQALGAVNVVKPFSSFVIFITSLVSIGTSVFYSYEIGKFDKEKADGLFGQGIILAVISGVILFLTGLLGKNFYFDYLNLSPQIEEAASAYFFYYQFVILLLPVYTVLLELIYADGDGMICNISSIVQIGLNVVVSIVLCYHIGIMGVGLGTLLGVAFSVVILLVHFFRKQNTLRFVWHISRIDVFRVLKCGITDASAYLFMGMTSFIASKFVIYYFSEYYLPVLLVVINILELTIIFDGIGQAITPIVNVYRGEENHVGIKRAMKTALMYAVAEGVSITVLLFLFGGNVAELFGLANHQLVHITKNALRLVSPFFFCTGILFLQTTYYMIIEKIFLATAITGIKDWLIPSLSLSVLGLLFGIDGVWIAFGISPFISIVVVALIIYVRYGREKFPLLLERETNEVYIFDAELISKNVIKLRDQIEELLSQKGITPKSIHRIMLFIEEVGMLIHEKNPEKKVFCECSVLIGDDVQVIIRDDGVLIDVTNPDNDVESLRCYVVSHMMNHTRYKQSLTTTGYNRNTFRFEK